ncbi:hypothetical protein GEMRC1_001216 [Eukaryota sp. GEM-RC1]
MPDHHNSSSEKDEVAVNCKTCFHALTGEDSLKALHVTIDEGLSSFQVDKVRSERGKNELTMGKQKSKLLIFLLQFHQPLIYILLVAGVVTAFLDPPDSIAIFGVVLVNAIVGFVQEVKAAAAINALSKKMVSFVTVKREGQKVEIGAVELVPGDIMYLRTGQRVPADCRILEANDLSIDESALTGESVPVMKMTFPLEERIALGDRKNMGFSSTIITRGGGLAVVTETGDDTEIGKINHLIQTSTEIKTPLTEKIEKFAHGLMYAIIGLSILSYFLAFYRANMDWIDSFHSSVAVAVSAIPEGLPAALTITLSIGVWRMAKRNAIIRVLPAVETLGSTSVICSDKTGTLTTNQMTVKAVHVCGKTHAVSGVGYAPEGSIENINEHVISVLETGAYCNDSFIVHEDNGNYKCTGDPTEGCLLVSASKAGIVSAKLSADHRYAQIPFNSEHMYMATLNKNKDEEYILHVKGALSKLEGRCTHILSKEGPIELTKELSEQLNAAADKAAEKGLRVLALCRKTFEVPAESTKIFLSDEDISGLCLLGFQALYDPPRSTVFDAIACCLSAGITVKMLTGDHAKTALSIAKEIGLTHKEDTNVVTGNELDDMTDEQLRKAVKVTQVFARVSPEHKLRIVNILQGQGEVAAVTGDGTNDSPALKQADIGVAMGLAGTDVAKEAADCVLTDDAFDTIVNAVEEGRSVFANLVKFILWTIPTNAGECSVIIMALILGQDLPLQPLHVLYINMVTAVCLGLMLAFEPAGKGIMKMKPRRRDAPLFTRSNVFRTIIVSIYLTTAAFVVFEYALQHYTVVEANTAVINTFVMVETFYLFDCRCTSKSCFAIGFFKNKMILLGVLIQMVIQLLLVYTPIMNTLFDTMPVSWELWAVPVGFGFGVSVIVQLHKFIDKLRGPKEEDNCPLNQKNCTINKHVTLEITGTFTTYKSRKAR